MNLITTVGGSDSNSYMTIIEFEEMAESLGMPLDAWDAISPESQKNIRLVSGANVTDKMPWRGKKVYCKQRMAFPRTSQMSDPDDVWEDPPTVIPEEILIVQAHMTTVVTERLRNGFTVSDEGLGPGVSQLSLSGLLNVSFPKGSSSTNEFQNILDQSAREVQMVAGKYLTQIRGLIKYTCRELV